MFRFGLFVVIITIVRGDTTHDEIQKHCETFFNSNVSSCCVFELSLDDIEPIEVAECEHLPEESCEKDLCMAQHYDLFNKNGDIEKSTMKKAFLLHTDKYPDTVDAITEICVDGDVSNYGPENLCLIKKVVNCIRIHIYGRCPKWSDMNSCQTKKEYTMDCFKHLL